MNYAANPYGYAPFAPAAVPPAAFAQSPYPYPYAPLAPYRPMALFGQGPAKGALETVKDKLAEKGPLGITYQNYALGAGALGLIYVGYMQGWFR